MLEKSLKAKVFAEAVSQLFRLVFLRLPHKSEWLVMLRHCHHCVPHVSPSSQVPDPIWALPFLAENHSSYLLRNPCHWGDSPSSKLSSGYATVPPLLLSCSPSPPSQGNVCHAWRLNSLKAFAISSSSVSTRTLLYHLLLLSTICPFICSLILYKKICRMKECCRWCAYFHPCVQARFDSHLPLSVTISLHRLYVLVSTPKCWYSRASSSVSFCSHPTSVIHQFNTSISTFVPES